MPQGSYVYGPDDSSVPSSARVAAFRAAVETQRVAELGFGSLKSRSRA